jgi:hypothetical protein
MEEVWYIDPDLMAGEEQSPALGAVESEGFPIRDETVTLGDSDLEDVVHSLEGDLTDEGRHYCGVSLRGALLVPDSTSDDFEVGHQGTLAAVFNAASSSPALVALLCFLAGVSLTVLGIFLAL